eukprot:1188413-Prorocentrum_minimum.AAC.1
MGGESISTVGWCFLTRGLETAGAGLVLGAGKVLYCNMSVTGGMPLISPPPGVPPGCDKGPLPLRCGHAIVGDGDIYIKGMPPVPGWLGQADWPRARCWATTPGWHFWPPPRWWHSLSWQFCRRRHPAARHVSPPRALGTARGTGPPAKSAGSSSSQWVKEAWEEGSTFMDAAV